MHTVDDLIKAITKPRRSKISTARRADDENYRILADMISKGRLTRSQMNTVFDIFEDKWSWDFLSNVETVGFTEKQLSRRLGILECFSAFPRLLASGPNANVLSCILYHWDRFAKALLVLATNSVQGAALPSRVRTYALNAILAMFNGHPELEGLVETDTIILTAVSVIWSQELSFGFTLADHNYDLIAHLAAYTSAFTKYHQSGASDSLWLSKVLQPLGGGIDAIAKNCLGHLQLAVTATPPHVAVIEKALLFMSDLSDHPPLRNAFWPADP